MCQPKVAGGMNLLDSQRWNKAAMCKLLWNLCSKKEILWVIWVHTYYIKLGSVWEAKCKQASWVVKKILNAKRYLDDINWVEQDLEQMDNFSVKQAYMKMGGELPRVEWRRFICNNAGCPKWTFILQLALLGRLLTKDRLEKWGSTVSTECVFCRGYMEDHDHLFFECSYSQQIWNSMLMWQGVDRQAGPWREEKQWAISQATGKNAKAELYRMCLVGTIYHIWLERNGRIFKQETRNTNAF